MVVVVVVYAVHGMIALGAPIAATTGWGRHLCTSGLSNTWPAAVLECFYITPLNEIKAVSDDSVLVCRRWCSHSRFSLRYSATPLLRIKTIVDHIFSSDCQSHCCCTPPLYLELRTRTRTSEEHQVVERRRARSEISGRRAWPVHGYSVPFYFTGRVLDIWNITCFLCFHTFSRPQSSRFSTTSKEEVARSREAKLQPA